MLAMLALLAAQGCKDVQQGAASTARNEIPENEFREVARALSEGPVSGELLAVLLGRASAQQGSYLVKAAALPRRASRAETLTLLARIWKGEAADIPIANDPVFRVSVASALHRLDERQCAGCYEYALGLLSAQDTDVRTAAVLEMSNLGSPDDIPALRQMIVVDDFRVAQSAATALTGIASGTNSIPILQDVMSDAAISAEKRALLAQIIEGVERRQAIIERLRGN